MLPAFSRPGAGRPAKLAFENRMQAVGIWRWERRRAGSPASGRVVSSVWSDDHPSLSPDGRRMAFTSNRGGTSELWLANSDGTGLKQLSDYGGPKPVASRWSPDGRSLVFAAEDGGNHDIFVMDHEGAASRRVVGGPSEEGNPSWSMDGNWIYFRSDRGGSVRIWRVPSTGGQAIVVTAAPGSQAFESSDGRLLYYTKGTNTRGVWAVPVEGGSEVEVLPGVREGYWAVSDRGILFLAPESPDLYANQAIMLFSPATRTISRVAAIPADGGQTLPGFAASRDGRSVLWSQVDSQVSDIVLLDPWGN
jgi:WD40 repeat protein